MRFIITGASGFVGRQLVPRLIKSGCKLLLVGRNPSVLEKHFPGVPNCGYKKISTLGRGFDAIVHLAVINNNDLSSYNNFKKVNVDLLLEILSTARGAGVSRFVNITTFHALDGKGSHYAKSKRLALDALENEKDINVSNVFLPAIYGEEFSGKLSKLNIIPRYLRPATLMIVSSLLPILHVDRLARFIAFDIERASGTVMLADLKENNVVYRAGNWLINVIFAISVIGLLGWLLIFVWILVRLDSPGPGIFAQERVGKNKKTFICYKFRTMKSGTRQTGTHELNEGSVTKIGAFLRKTKIDELPQVWNILRGELSLVGPRPCLPVQKELIAAREENGVFDVLPGITGLAQINGIDMSDPKRLALMDASYIAMRGLIMEMKIVILTFMGRGQGDKVRS